MPYTLVTFVALLLAASSSVTIASPIPIPPALAQLEELNNPLMPPMPVRIQVSKQSKTCIWYLQNSNLYTRSSSRSQNPSYQRCQQSPKSPKRMLLSRRQSRQMFCPSRLCRDLRMSQKFLRSWRVRACWRLCPFCRRSERMRISIWRICRHWDR